MRIISKGVIALKLLFSALILFAVVFTSYTVRASDEYDIGAFYFSAWNPVLNPSQLREYEKIYGRTGDFWSGVKDHLTEPGPWGNGPIPYREPAAGWYDDRQQSVIDQQILQASSRGLSHFAFYYYWKDNGGGERPGQQTVHNFTTSQYKDLMKFYLYFVADGTWPSSDWNTLIVPKLVDFMKDSSYKKTPDGRPIVGFYGDMVSRFGGEAQLKTALEYLRTAAQSAGLKNPLLVVNGYRTLKPFIQNQGYDGFLPLNLAGLGLDTYVSKDYAASYPQAWNDFVYADYASDSKYENYENYLFIPGGLSAFDPRPWGRAHDKYVYTDPSPFKFRAQLQNIKNYLDTHPRSMNMSTIYAWNENGEGGTMEPTTIHGFGYLNAIQEVFGLSNTAYKQKIGQLALPDLDPGLRLEFSPEYASVTDGQTVKIKGKVTNQYSSPIDSGTISLNTGGWVISSSTGTSLASLASGGSQDVEFQIEVGNEAFWTKHTLTASASFTANGQVSSESVSTFVVKTPKVYGVVERPQQTALKGDVIDLQVNIRNYSLDAQSGDYSLTIPEGWYITDSGKGAFALSGYSGSEHSNIATSKIFKLAIPDNTPYGSYTIKTAVSSGGVITESTTTVVVGNYMNNGGFEVDSDGDGLADTWQKMTNTTVTSLSTDSVEGTRSQQITSTGYGGGIRQEWFTVQPNRTYTVSAWVKVVSGKIRMEEDEGESNNKWLGTNAYKDITGNTWTKYTFSYVTKPTASKMSIRFLTYTSGQTVAYIDNVEFYSVSSVPVTGVTLDKESDVLNIGDTDMIKAIVSPENAIGKTVIFDSSDNAVATVSDVVYNPADGKTSATIKATGIGTATITATTLEGLKTAVCPVRVLPVLANITAQVEKTLLKPAETEVLFLTSTMSDGTQADMNNAQITYTSDNEQVVITNQNNTITAVGDGIANIKVSVTIHGVTKEWGVQITVDGTPPITSEKTTGTLRSDGTYNSYVVVTLTAEDPQGRSGVKKTMYSLDGTNWLEYNGPILLKDNGVYSIGYKTSDIAGNDEIAKNIRIIVAIDPEVMTKYLMDNLDSMTIEQGIKNSLASKLNNALRAIQEADNKSSVNKLNSFINEVTAQKGKKLTIEQEDELKCSANKIIAALDALEADTKLLK